MGEQQAQAEQTFVENSFGTVTSKRIIYREGRGWLGGGTRQDIPLQHITSVSFSAARSTAAGIVLLLIGLGLLVFAPGIAKIFGLVACGAAALLLWGQASVEVNTAGQDRKPSKGPPWKRGEANAFVEALRKQLFKP